MKAGQLIRINPDIFHPGYTSTTIYSEVKNMTDLMFGMFVLPTVYDPKCTSIESTEIGLLIVHNVHKGYWNVLFGEKLMAIPDETWGKHMELIDV